MISIYQLKSRFQHVLRPLVHALYKKGITPNQITVSAIILSFLPLAYYLFFDVVPLFWLSVPIVLFIRMALNAIDGMLARDFNMKSKLGAVLNEMGDIISDAALYILFVAIAPKLSFLVFLICFLAMLTEVSGIIAVQIGASRRYDGPMGKSDRAFLFGLLAFLIAIGVNIIPWLAYMYSIVCILLIYTIFNRLNSALKEVD